MRALRMAILALGACLAAPAAAIDGVSFEAGGGDGTRMWRAGVQWDWNKRWLAGGGWHLGAYWDLQLGRWSADARPGNAGSLIDVGLTPVFRFQRDDLAGPYAEAAIGFHFLSERSIGAKRFGTSFQFGDHIGVGYRFGRQGWDVSLRLQHLSNGGIEKPNPGINFGQLRLQYRF